MNPELLLAYVVIGSTATALVYSGSFIALKKIKDVKDSRKKVTSDSDSSSEEETEALTAEDAYLFPIYGSGALFSLYLVFKFVNKEYVDYLVSTYFAMAETFAGAKLFSLIARNVVSKDQVPKPFRLALTQGPKRILKAKFNYFDLGSFFVSMVLTGYYIWSKNWIASNIFGIAFSLSAIQLIDLDSFKTGWILLGGLFFYDVFWVFGTDVMVTVAKKFNAPIKLLWPKSFTPDIPGGPLKFTLLGLGDIVMPGIFVALCLKFDRHNAIQNAEKMGDSGADLLKSIKRHPVSANYPKPYFNACLGAYICGLFTTIFVMHTFKAAQPALLYLSPACSAAPLVVALFKGQFQELIIFTTEKPKEATNSDDTDAAPGSASKEATVCDSSESDSATRNDTPRRRRTAGSKP